MHVVDPPDLFGGLNSRYFEIDHNGVLPASNQHALERLAGACVDLLVRNEGRHVNEIAGTGFGGELELITPTHPGAALDDVDDALELAVMMSAGPGVGMDGDRSSPEFRGAGTRVSDCRGAIHAGRLRGVCIKLARANNTNAVMFPIACLVAHGG